MYSVQLVSVLGGKFRGAWEDQFSSPAALGRTNSRPQPLSLLPSPSLLPSVKLLISRLKQWPFINFCNLLYVWWPLQTIVIEFWKKKIDKLKWTMQGRLIYTVGLYFIKSDKAYMWIIKKYIHIIIPQNFLDKYKHIVYCQNRDFMSFPVPPFRILIRQFV